GKAPAEGYLFGVEPGGAERWAPRRHGYQLDLNEDPDSELFLPMADQRAYLEVFCAADHGSLAGYREADGRIEPVLVDGWAGMAEDWGLGAMRTSLAAAATSLDLEGIGPEAVAAMRAPIHALLERFWTDPT